jgi:hypothetical protein
MMLIGLYFLIFGFSSFRGTLAAVGFVFFGKYPKKKSGLIMIGLTQTIYT